MTGKSLFKQGRERCRANSASWNVYNIYVDFTASIFKSFYNPTDFHRVAEEYRIALFVLYSMSRRSCNLLCPASNWMMHLPQPRVFPRKHFPKR